MGPQRGTAIFRWAWRPITAARVTSSTKSFACSGDVRVMLSCLVQPGEERDVTQSSAASFCRDSRGSLCDARCKISSLTAASQDILFAPVLRLGKRARAGLGRCQLAITSTV